MSEWKAGSFTVATDDGPAHIAGWINGLFALDFRVFDRNHPMAFDHDFCHGWGMTHIPTGRICAGLLVPLDEAKSLAERIGALGDWDFTDHQKANAFGNQMVALRDELDGKLLLRSAAFGPLFFNAGGRDE